MPETGDGVRGFYAVAPADLKAIRADFEANILGSAKRLQLIPANEQPQDILRRFEAGRTMLLRCEPGSGLFAGWPAKEKATALVELLAVVVAYAGHELKENPAGDEWAHTAVLVRNQMRHLAGYLEAMADMRAETARRGANGRRLIGATTRDRVRSAAQTHRGQMSREAAAPLVADLVGKSPATVRRLLSALFPGEAWDDPASDASTDVDGQDG